MTLVWILVAVLSAWVLVALPWWCILAPRAKTTRPDVEDGVEPGTPPH